MRVGRAAFNSFPVLKIQKFVSIHEFLYQHLCRNAAQMHVPITVFAFAKTPRVPHYVRHAEEGTGNSDRDG